MTVEGVRKTTWPRTRLQLRSIISSTMVIGWTWVAASALIPYFLTTAGRWSADSEVFGVARTTWMSMHVWASITIGLLTIGHALLNRRGVYRSVRILSGAPAVTGRQWINGVRRKRGSAWVVALAAIVVVTAGSVGFAAVDSHGSMNEASGGLGRGGRNTTAVDEGHDAFAERESDIGAVEP